MSRPSPWTEAKISQTFKDGAPMRREGARRMARGTRDEGARDRAQVARHGGGIRSRFPSSLPLAPCALVPCAPRPAPCSFFYQRVRHPRRLEALSAQMAGVAFPARALPAPVAAPGQFERDEQRGAQPHYLLLGKAQQRRLDPQGLSGDAALRAQPGGLLEGPEEL